MAGYKIEGLDKLIAKLKGLEEVLEDDVDIIVREGMNDMNNAAVRNLNNQNIHDLGYLLKSQQFNIGPMPRMYSVTNSAEYAPFHEWGTGGLVRVPDEWKEIAILFKGKGIKVVNIKPRPFIVPAYNQYKPIILKNVKDAINEAIK